MSRRLGGRRQVRAEVTSILDRQERREAAARREAEARAGAFADGLEPCEVDVDLLGQTEHERRISDDLRGFDPDCPFVASNPLHTCTTNTGQLTRPGQSCYPGARASMANHPSAGGER